MSAFTEHAKEILAIERESWNNAIEAAADLVSREWADGPVIAKDIRTLKR